jgi:hypothetical protein
MVVGYFENKQLEPVKQVMPCLKYADHMVEQELNRSAYLTG